MSWAIRSVLYGVDDDEAMGIGLLGTRTDGEEFVVCARAKGLGWTALNSLGCLVVTST